MSSGNIPSLPKKQGRNADDSENEEEPTLQEEDSGAESSGDDIISNASESEDDSSAGADTSDMSEDDDAGGERGEEGADSSSDERGGDGRGGLDDGGGEAADEEESTAKKNKKKRVTSSGRKKNPEDDMTLLGVPHGIYFDDDDDDDDDSEDDKDSSEYFQKLKSTVRESFVHTYHPESLSHNYDEIQTLARVVRNNAGVIIDDLHRTIPIMTKYEKTRILGQRAKQINEGAPAFIKIDSTVIDGYLIAVKELEQKKTPFIIRRPLPNGGSEYWRVQDLEIL